MLLHADSEDSDQTGRVFAGRTCVLLVLPCGGSSMVQINLSQKACLTVSNYNWALPSEFGTYRLCEQRRFRRACASAQSRQNLRCSLIQAVRQEEPSEWKPDPWLLWIAGHAQLKFVMTECSKTQIRLTGLNFDKEHYNSATCTVIEWGGAIG